MITKKEIVKVLKRFLKGCITLILMITVCGCGSSKEANDNSSSELMSSQVSFETIKETETIAETTAEESLLSVVGVYYGDIYKNQSGSCYSDQKLDGFSDCIVVFDYMNDALNRTLPASLLESGKLYSSGFTCPDVTLLVNGANTYEAYDPNGYKNHYANALSRYTSYSNPIGYGNLLGSADPVRMYSVFYVNPNELKADSTAVLTVGDQSVEFSFESIKNIEYPDEIMSAEDNYEELQQIAAFKWRMDKVIEITEDADHYMDSMDPGSDLSGVGSSIINLFSSDYGVTISGQLSAGFDPDHTFNGMNGTLPAFDLDMLTSACPDQAEDITGLVEATDRLGSAIQDSSYSKSDVKDIVNELFGYYSNLISAFGMEIYKG